MTNINADIDDVRSTLVVDNGVDNVGDDAAFSATSASSEGSSHRVKTLGGSRSLPDARPHDVPDPRYSSAVLEEDQPTIYESLGALVAPGMAASLALYEDRGGFAVGPRCRPCIGRSCNRMSEADAPFCADCRREHERRAMASR